MLWPVLMRKSGAKPCFSLMVGIVSVQSFQARINGLLQANRHRTATTPLLLPTHHDAEPFSVFRRQALTLLNWVSPTEVHFGEADCEFCAGPWTPIHGPKDTGFPQKRMSGVKPMLRVRG